MKWGPARPKTRIKVIECGVGPHGIDTIEFRVTGTGHERIEQAFDRGCRDCGRIVGLDEKQPEQRIAAWLCQHACSFVLFDTKARASFEREDDADAFRQAFVASAIRDTNICQKLE